MRTCSPRRGFSAESPPNSIHQNIRAKGGNNTKFSLPETDRYVENINDIYGYKIKKEIYKKISDPIAIIAAKSESKSDEQRFISHRVIVLVDLSVDGHQVIAPIIVDAQSNINGKRIDTNILATYFDKGNISNMLSEAVALENDNKVGFYYLDKKRAQSLLMKSGLQLPSRLNKIGSDIIIRNISENVNRKIDTVLKSQQFIRWFGDWQNSP